MSDLDPKLDLFFERIVDVPKELIWKAWTQPQHLMPWFCPPAVEDHRMRDRAASRRAFLYRDAITRRRTIPQ